MSVMHARTFARRREEPRAAGGPLDLLRALGWTVRGETPWPGRRGDSLDNIVAGPPGVFAVRLSGSEALLGDLAVAAAELSELLGTPVTPVLCLRPGTGLDEERAGVRLCSPDTLLDMLLRSPTTLDASAARRIGAAVQDLEVPVLPLPTLVEEAVPQPPEEVPEPRIAPVVRLEEAPQPPPPPVFPPGPDEEEPALVLEPRHRRSLIERARDLRLSRPQLPELRFALGAAWGTAPVTPALEPEPEPVPEPKPVPEWVAVAPATPAAAAGPGRVRRMTRAIIVTVVLSAIGLGGVTAWTQHDAVTAWMHHVLKPMSASYGETLRVGETPYHPDLTLTVSSPVAIPAAGALRNVTWYAVDVAITDRGARAGRVPASGHVALRDSWGEDRSPFAGATTLPLGTDLGPGATATGRLVFALPSERTPGALHIVLADDGSQTATFSSR